MQIDDLVVISTDLKSEKVLGRGSEYYVPRDEAFEDLKKEAYVAGNIKLFVHELLPMIEKTLTKASEFKYFSDIEHLYKESFVIQQQQQPDLMLKMVGLFSKFNFNNYKQALPRFLEMLEDSVGIQFTKPLLFASKESCSDIFFFIGDWEHYMFMGVELKPSNACDHPHFHRIPPLICGNFAI